MRHTTRAAGKRDGGRGAAERGGWAQEIYHD